MSPQTNGIRRILNRDRVRVVQSGVMVGCERHGSDSSPVIELRKDSHTGRIRQIEITCSCGEVITIDCGYDG